VAMVSDANAARFDEDHNIGFSTVFQSFGDVVTTAEAIDDLVLTSTAR
jgi:ureidoacrylate peracid hydrolase